MLLWTFGRRKLSESILNIENFCFSDSCDHFGKPSTISGFSLKPRFWTKSVGQKARFIEAGLVCFWSSIYEIYDFARVAMGRAESNVKNYSLRDRCASGFESAGGNSCLRSWIPTPSSWDIYEINSAVNMLG